MGGGKETGFTITKEKKMKTSACGGDIIILRQALREDDGKDKNVVASLPPSILQYKKNGVDVVIEFYTSAGLPRNIFKWAFALAESQVLFFCS